jgi:hypothetical protein
MSRTAQRSYATGTHNEKGGIAAILSGTLMGQYSYIERSQRMNTGNSYHNFSNSGMFWIDAKDAFVTFRPQASQIHARLLLLRIVRGLMYTFIIHR